MLELYTCGYVTVGSHNTHARTLRRCYGEKPQRVGDIDVQLLGGTQCCTVCFMGAVHYCRKVPHSDSHSSQRAQERATKVEAQEANQVPRYNLTYL